MIPTRTGTDVPSSMCKRSNTLSDKNSADKIAENLLWCRKFCPPNFGPTNLRWTSFDLFPGHRFLGRQKYKSAEYFCPSKMLSPENVVPRNVVR